jgi:hypothetical protein
MRSQKGRNVTLFALIVTFFQDFWLEAVHVIARANARSNPAFADLKSRKLDELKSPKCRFWQE